MRINAAAFLMGLWAIAWPTSGFGQAVASPTYGGEAVALRATYTQAAPATLVYSGRVPSDGGERENSSFVGTAPGIVAHGLYAMSFAQNGENHSAAKLTDIVITMGGHQITAQNVTADATAKNDFLRVTTAGRTGFIQLTVDGANVAVSGAANQTARFANGYLIMNEQIVSPGRNSGAITVNGLHLALTGIGDVIAASAQAEVIRPVNAP